MGDLHKETHLETEICGHLAANGWLYAEDDAKGYDRALALYPADLIAWVRETQPKAWEALAKDKGADTGVALAQRVRQILAQRGALETLRHGVDMVGLKQALPLAQFKPAMSMNPDTIARYAANRLRVVRQVHYSLQNENSIDLVLFLNGIPVATAELKSDFTQSVQDAVDQYRFDRDPQPKGKPAEPLLGFPSGALVHFAVSNSEVYMTTRLKGAKTRFLPFNKGHDGGAGNPPNPKGHPTAYLWEEVWQRESWLEILGRYLVAERDGKKQIKAHIFPRYHQLDATRKLQAAILKDGEDGNGKYLIQHSAGSGKTYSIAWTAHFLSDLHSSSDKNLFDSVLVVSDRTVLDEQLREAIFSFERTMGVVASITNEGSSKSKALTAALSGNKKIVVCTIQTFPFALEMVQKLAATEGKRFAVIADEAHSSQTGEAAAKLKAVLNADELKDLEDGGEVSTEDVLAAEMAARAAKKGITYVAFTATPKHKTLELFGQRPRPDQPAGPDNLPEPFHVYSMRQAIEEGFILDVLKNYTPFKTAFRLAYEGKEYDDTQVERSEALKSILRWVQLHPYNVSEKVQMVVEHFRKMVQPLLRGRGKAMVVVGSRLEAVRWKLAMDAYIRSQAYKLGSLVAFSGEVNDKESGPEPFTENSKTLNPALKGRDIRRAFATDDFSIMIAANKFQTGFDQPLLCGMYVDKRLASIHAVQTLSRLNRAYPGKDNVYVVDFRNDPAEILAAFKIYHTTAELEDVTDPNLVLNLRAKLDASGHYDTPEVERVVTVVLNPKAKQSDLVVALTPVADRLLRRFKAAKEALAAALADKDETAAREARDAMNSLALFKRDLMTYLRMYAFLSQIFDYGDTDVEKRAIFYKRLLPLLEFGREREGVDLSKVVLTHHSLKSQGKVSLPLNEGETPKIKPMTESGDGSVQEKEKALLADIIARVNDLFEGDLTDDDKLVYVNNVLKGKLLESDLLVQQAMSNTKEQFANSPDLAREILNAIMDALEAHTTMSTQAINSEKVRAGLKDVLLGPGRLYESLRQVDGVA
ncbi:type I restriction endonuclease subunit R [Desulfovibrio aminophilus]|uniref:type I restriction endonuclease subunit R n=1 Tax=Desulfovibrio aminophilus TaxID=81425 RepID=UPI00041CD3EF|nr:DEAD/DEAH box helicase family protein [Desulfovibrio aminophilus]